MSKNIAGVVKPFSYWRFVTPFVLALALVFAVVPAALASPKVSAASLVGPKKHYLALGNSLAFGFQPDLNFDEGYADDFFTNLKGHGVTEMANLGCPGETSVSMLNGTCPFPLLRKFPYVGSQLNAALIYLALHRGTVSPVTLDIGANDLLPDINTSTCAIDVAKFNAHMATVDANLRQTILPKLHNALMVNGQVTGDLLMMNYYDPQQNHCPNTIPYIQLFNQHLAQDISGFGTIVDVFSAFGGAATPNPNICNFTWMCSIFHDIHATNKGYSVIAGAFEQTAGY